MYRAKVTENVCRIWVIGTLLMLIVLILVVAFLRTACVWEPGRDKYTAISLTDGHTCGIRIDGTLRCWGSGSRRPPPNERFIAVAPGLDHACGLREGGSISCWGSLIDDYPNRISPNPGPEVSSGPFTSITAGGHHLCGLRTDGTAVCWGSDQWGAASPPDEERFTAISAGRKHTCGIRLDGSALCWGGSLRNAVSTLEDERLQGQPSVRFTEPLYDSDRVSITDSTPKEGLFKAISSGGGFACAIRMDDDIACWGQRGVQPFQMPPNIEGPFTFVSSGHDHACALRPSGAVHCWGSSSAPDNDNYGDNPVSGERFMSIGSSRNFNCGLRHDGTIKCWGGTHWDKLEPEF